MGLFGIEFLTRRQASGRQVIEALDHFLTREPLIKQSRKIN